jgi:hypothetical protein
MRAMPSLVGFSSLAAAIFVVSAPTWAADRQKAADGFAELCQQTTPSEAPAHPERFPDDWVKGRSGWNAAKTTEWRAALATRLRKATVTGVREGKTNAFVRATIEADDVEVPLRWDGSHWTLAAPREHLVAGPSFELTAKSGPVHVALTPYTAQADANFAKAAYCFGYATGDMARAKNRADLWCETKGRLSISGDGGIVDVGVGKLDKAKELPLADAWLKSLEKVQKGHVYVVHCNHRGRWDFYVALAVTKADARLGIEFDWNVLALGEGAPSDVKRGGKADDNDGADGLPGLDGD